MAIISDTNYTLKGSQLEELAARIVDAQSRVKAEITSTDPGAGSLTEEGLITFVYAP